MPARSGSHSPAPPDQFFMGSEQPVQISPLVLAVRLARLRANDQVIYLATVDEELLKCPGIATLLRRFALANGFSLDNCSNGSWGIHSLTGPASVISISLAGSISGIVVITFSSDSQQIPGQMILRESFRFVRGSNSWLLQEWDGRYLDLRQIYFDLQAFISHGIIRLASHPSTKQSKPEFSLGGWRSSTASEGFASHLRGVCGMTAFLLSTRRRRPASNLSSRCH